MEVLGGGGVLMSEVPLQTRAGHPTQKGLLAIRGTHCPQGGPRCTILVRSFYSTDLYQTHRRRVVLGSYAWACALGS